MTVKWVPPQSMRLVSQSWSEVAEVLGFDFICRTAKLPTVPALLPAPRRGYETRMTETPPRPRETDVALSPHSARVFTRPLQGSSPWGVVATRGLGSLVPLPASCFPRIPALQH